MATPAANTSAAPKAPRGAAKPSPSASTRPGKADAPTACEKKASPRSTTHVPSRPAPTDSSAISIIPRWTNGSWKGSSIYRLKIMGTILILREFAYYPSHEERERDESRVGRSRARGAEERGPSQRWRPLRGAGADRPPGLLPHRAGDLRLPALRRAGRGHRERLPRAGSAGPDGTAPARGACRCERLRAGAARRRAPPSHRLRAVRKGERLRGRRARAGDRPSRRATGVRGWRARGSASRRVRGLPHLTALALLALAGCGGGSGSGQGVPDDVAARRQ